MNVEALFDDPGCVDAVLFKIITKNDDSGRHGVLVPKEGYAMFPEFAGFDPESATNYTEAIHTTWPQLDGRRLSSSWKHYHRYPERRVTALRCRELDQAPPNTLILFGRHGRNSREYEVVVLYPGESGYDAVLDRFGFAAADASPGLFGVDLKWAMHGGRAPTSAALAAFLSKFDRLAAMGPVASLRRGPTGIGYTFETLLGITENNEMTGDFMGMEIKTYRSEELRMQDAEKMNLFLKEPVWIDGLKAAERVRQYGYVDSNGRTALYSTVGIRQSSHGFAFRIDDTSSRLWLTWNSTDVAYWPFETLERRLREKHSEAVFVAASTKRKGGVEHFRYRTVVHCVEPSIEAFMSLLAQGDIVLELRMHVRPNGSVRNHGSGFRVKKNRLQMLYATTVQVRPTAASDALSTAE